MSYETDRAALFEARETIARLHRPVLDEAVKRGQAYTLDYTFYGSENTEHFLTLDDALERSNGELYARSLRRPDGTELDTFTGEVAA
jgi:hypothetical protein